MRARELVYGHTRASARSDQGAVAVEFALVFPVLVMLLMGIITAGLSYTHAIGVTNAVREGARFGATTPTSPGPWASSVVNRVRSTQFDDGETLATSETAVCVQLFKTTDALGNGATVGGNFSCSTSASTPALDMGSAPSANGIAAGTCVVRVWAARRFEINVIIAPVLNGTVVKKSIARYERTPC